MRKLLSIFLIIITVISLTGCISIFSKKYTLEQLQMEYPTDSEQMFWIERYGIPDDIIIREGNQNSQIFIKYETFFWNKGKGDEIWIQFENDRATIFSFL